MTDYHATNIAEDWKMARGLQHTDSNSDHMGNLSYLLNSSKDKNIYSSTRRVGKIWDAFCEIEDWNLPN